MSLSSNGDMLHPNLQPLSFVPYSFIFTFSCFTAWDVMSALELYEPKEISKLCCKRVIQNCHHFHKRRESTLEEGVNGRCTLFKNVDYDALHFHTGLLKKRFQSKSVVMFTVV